jgi:catechol 2,3-dioxygenase-like lactoylglutathione lyase family enzyme
MASVRHLGIVVADLQQSLEFYCGLLGFEVGREMDEEGPFIDAILGFSGTRVRTVKLKGGGTAQLELLAFSKPARRARVELNCSGPTHVALEVGNLDVLHGKMEAAGVRFTTKPQLSPDGRARVTFCQDPDGTWLELVELVRA